MTARILSLFLLATLASSQDSARVVTATTTVAATASGAGACNNFYGACVVYGTDAAAPYTVTVWETVQPNESVTATQTVYIPADASSNAASSACNNSEGACVVYATNAQGGAQYTSTVQGGGNNNVCSAGGGGCIGQAGNGDGYIGAGSNLNMRFSCYIVAFGTIASTFWL